jgi:hypothetical protein
MLYSIIQSCGILLNLYDFLWSLWSTIRIIANGGAIILIALQRLGAIILRGGGQYGLVGTT